MNRTAKTGNLIALKIVDVDDDIMMINSNGIIIRIPAEEISIMVETPRCYPHEDGDDGKVVAVARVEDEDEDEENEEKADNENKEDTDS